MEVLQFMNRRGEPLEQGDVVVFGQKMTSLVGDPTHGISIPEVDVTDRPYDTRVCGIVSEIYTELKQASTDESTSQASGTKKKKPKGKAVSELQAFTEEELAELDRTKVEPDQVGWMITRGVYGNCKVDADISPITIGDLLTTSPTKGHAQKVLDPSQAVGAIIGKALGSLKKGKGRIPVLVMLQ